MLDIVVRGVAWYLLVQVATHDEEPASAPPL
jgi:hypothetical protein